MIEYILGETLRFAAIAVFAYLGFYLCKMQNPSSARTFSHILILILNTIGSVFITVSMYLFFIHGLSDKSSAKPYLQISIIIVANFVWLCSAGRNMWRYITYELKPKRG